MAAVLTLAAGMRFFRLTHWGFADNELFTLRDTLTCTDLSCSMKPLLFFLNHYLLLPFFEMNEFTLRLFPALFGIAGVAAVYFLTRRLINRRTALFASILTALSPWHLYWSQNARYQSLVFFLIVFVPVAFYVWHREGKTSWLVAGVVLAVLAVLAHPSAALVVAGGVVWVVGAIVLKAIRGNGLSRGALVLGGGTALLFSVAVATYLVPMLLFWEDYGEPWSYAGPVLLMSYGNWITAGVGLFAAGGVVWMWRDGRRKLAFLIGLSVGVPLVSLSLLGYWVPVATGYAFATFPFVLIAAGYLVDRFSRLGDNAVFTAAVSVVCIGTIVATGLPTLLSQYMDGSRPHFRRTAEHLESRIESGDIVLTDESVPLDYYLDPVDATGFPRDSARLDAVLESRARAGNGSVWIVAWMRERGGFNNQGLGDAREWVWRHCVLDAKIGKPRLDYKSNDLHVYRCSTESITDGSVRTRRGQE